MLMHVAITDLTQSSNKLHCTYNNAVIVIHPSGVLPGRLKSRERTSRDWTTWDHMARVDIARPDNVAPDSKGGHRKTGQRETISQGWTSRDLTTTSVRQSGTYYQMNLEILTVLITLNSSWKQFSVVATIVPSALEVIFYGHARFCESCVTRVSEMAMGCPVCRSDITTVVRIFF